VVSAGEDLAEYHAATMTGDPVPPQTRRRRRTSTTSLARGYPALTSALHRDRDRVCAEILEFDIASEGDNLDRAYAMIVEAVEGLIAAAYHDSRAGLDEFIRQGRLTVYPEPPETYRPAAIPGHLLSQPGLILRPVVISIATATVA
jgi:hypothetical protein